VILKATAFTEDSAGYGRLLELLGTATDCLVAMAQPDITGAISMPRW